MTRTLLPLILAAAACAPADASPAAGETYEITMIRESSQEADDQSSGSSYDKDTLVERLVAERPDGLELEYDLPKDATKQDREADWQFPARIFRPFAGDPRLLNREELETRIDRWLNAAKWTRGMCGRLIFTWNAFRIECDPQSVVQSVEPFDLRSLRMKEGAAYTDPGALRPGSLARTAETPDGSIWIVEMAIDPEVFRKERAEADVGVGQLLGKPVTFDEALKRHTGDRYSGTIAVTFDADPAGNVRRRTKVTRLETREAGGRVQTDQVTETVERRLISAGD